MGIDGNLRVDASGRTRDASYSRAVPRAAARASRRHYVNATGEAARGLPCLLPGSGPDRPVVFVDQNADDAGSLAAAIALHFDKHRIELGELGAGGAFVVEDQWRAIGPALIVPEPLVVLDFDPELLVAWPSRYPLPWNLRCTTSLRGAVGGATAVPAARVSALRSADASRIATQCRLCR